MRALLVLLTTTATLLGAPAWADDPHGWDRGQGHGYGRDHHGDRDGDDRRDDHDRYDRDDDHARPGTLPPAPPPPVGHVRPGGPTPPPPGYGHGPRGVPPGVIELCDDAGTDVDVYVDGAWLGPVQAGGSRAFPFSAGPHTVTVRARLDGAILLDQRVDLFPGRPLPLRLAPPLMPVLLTNSGPTPVFVTSVVDARGFWLLPGGRQRVDLPVGLSRVTTQVYTPRGLTLAAQHDVAVPYGARNLVRDVSWIAPPPGTRVTLSSLEARTVRVWIDGREVAVIPPGGSREILVAPGRHDVVVTEDGGRVLWNAPADFAARGRYQVEIHHGVRVKSAFAML